MATYSSPVSQSMTWISSFTVTQTQDILGSAQLIDVVVNEALWLPGYPARLAPLEFSRVLYQSYKGLSLNPL